MEKRDCVQDYEASWKDAGQLIRMLVNTVACGGNLLMNVGPTSLGTFDPRALNALAVYRDWMALHGEAIYGCTQSAYPAPQDCRLTQNGDKVYIHVYAWPFKHLVVPELAGRVSYARFLHDGSEIKLKPEDWSAHQLQLSNDVLVLELPVKQPDVVVPVIELTLK
ncbi:MAG TPA: alpha-L-fucosidase [Anaerolineae bacterium]|nr:alpha-L-fucosidase [Anaerolineae bacterium]HQI85104.1 alpha-L-fucosidase [Anaerolineae bacterium]